MSSGDAPTAVAISPKKRRQASLSAGAFSQEGLRAFAERLVSGKASTHLLQVSISEQDQAANILMQFGSQVSTC